MSRENRKESDAAGDDARDQHPDDREDGDPMVDLPGVPGKPSGDGGDQPCTDFKAQAPEDTECGPEDISGILVAFGGLELDDVIDERQLGQLFNRSPESVRRAVNLGHLPPPVRVFGAKVWTVRVLVKHFEKRLECAGRDRENTVRRFEKNRP